MVKPLFPRYLFCRFDVGNLFRAVRYAPEVTDIVSIGSTPTIVSPALLDELKSWAGDEVDILTLQPSLKVGDRVEVTAGPLQGLSGIIMKESEENVRVTILLSFLQYGTHLNVDRAEIRLIA